MVRHIFLSPNRQIINDQNSVKCTLKAIYDEEEIVFLKIEQLNIQTYTMKDDNSEDEVQTYIKTFVIGHQYAQTKDTPTHILPIDIPGLF